MLLRSEGLRPAGGHRQVAWVVRSRASVTQRRTEKGSFVLDWRKLEDAELALKVRKL